MGMCTRGSQCKFAHTVQETRPLPNLCRTKLCPVFNFGGVCDGTCRFAHSSEELRGRQQQHQQKVQHQSEWQAEQEDEWQQQREHQELLWQQSQAYGQQLTRCSMFKGSDVPDIRRASSIGQQIYIPSPDAPPVACPPVACLLSGGPRNEESVSTRAASEVSSPRGTQRSEVTPKISKNMFHKTKLCKFFPMGLCNHGRHCKYAHAVKDLNPMPDLCCTKLCPGLTATGACNKQRCTYAHCQEELRQAKRLYDMKAQSLMSNWMSENAQPLARNLQTHDASTTGDDAQMSSWADEAATLLVKNTFLHFTAEPPAPLRARSNSVPVLTSDNQCL